MYEVDREEIARSIRNNPEHLLAKREHLHHTTMPRVPIELARLHQAYTALPASSQYSLRAMMLVLWASTCRRHTEELIPEAVRRLEFAVLEILEAEVIAIDCQFAIPRALREPTLQYVDGSWRTALSGAMELSLRRPPRPWVLEASGY